MLQSRLMKIVLVLTYSYLALLFGWAVLHWLFGDRWWWLFLITSLVFYLFLPLVAVPLVALKSRRHELWLGFGVGAILWGNLYGSLFVPYATAHTSFDQATLSIMTYNMLRHTNQAAAQIDAIRAADADIVALQELNQPAAEAIHRELAQEYPYQVLAPGAERAGMGVISRYPIRDTGSTLPGEWIGRPQILKFEFDNTTITLINVHAISTTLGYGGDVTISPDRIEESIRDREDQMRTLVQYIDNMAAPVIVTGDFNTTDLSDAYTIVTTRLHDAWRVAGSGAGHTFPGAASPGSSRPRIVGLPIPKWLVRIDYIFYTDHWQATSASLGQWDGLSDHRPVMAQLHLQE